MKEVDGHADNKHYELIKHFHVPKNVEIVLSVWGIHCKCNLTTNEITKFKARLNILGDKQAYGINYFKAYAPVVTWFAIRLLIIFAILFKWTLKQVDFVMAYTQTPIEIYMYMELPAVIDTKNGNSKSHVIKLLTSQLSLE